VDAAVVDALETCVEAGADLDDRAFRVLGEEAPHPVVEEQGAQAGTQQAGLAVEAREVVVDGLHHRHGRRVVQQPVRVAGLHGPAVERDQQRLLDGAQPRAVCVSHATAAYMKMIVATAAAAAATAPVP
jgi:hypothetical protein